jgi:hypothetical protein
MLKQRENPVVTVVAEKNAFCARSGHKKANKKKVTAKLTVLFGCLITSQQTVKRTAPGHWLNGRFVASTPYKCLGT